MTKRTSPQRTPTAEVETAVLDAAERIVAAGGPGALSIRGLAKDAGVAPMSIYNRFGDKEGVLLALFVRGFDELIAHISPAADAPPVRTAADAHARMRASCAGYRAFALASPGTYSLMFEQGHADVEPDDHAMARAAEAFFVLVRAIELAQSVGAVVGGNPAELAQRVWACIHGAMSLELRQIRFVDDMEAHYAAVVDTVLVGIAPEGGTPGIDGELLRPRSNDRLAVPR